MIDFSDEIYDQNGSKGLLVQLARHLFFLGLGFLVLFLPCYLVFLLILNFGG